MLRFTFALAMLSVVVLGCGLPPLRRPISRVTIANGLTNPRQLEIGPDGSIYVAEVGSESTGGAVARIVEGRVEMVATGLPYAIYQGNEEVGTSGLALRHGEIYVVQGEGGGALGSQLLRVHPGQRVVDRVANLAGFQQARDPRVRFAESNPFSMVYEPASDTFYVVDSAANELLRVTPLGEIQVVAAWRNDDVPTGLSIGPDGNVYVALFSPYPYRAGSGHVDRVSPNGTIVTAASGLTTPIGVAFGPDGAMYILQFAGGYRDRAPIGFIPDSGSIVRVNGSTRTIIVGELPFPTAILARPAGTLLVSVHGAFSAPGTGRIEELGVR